MNQRLTLQHNPNKHLNYDNFSLVISCNSANQRTRQQSLESFSNTGETSRTSCSTALLRETAGIRFQFPRQRRQCDYGEQQVGILFIRVESQSGQFHSNLSDLFKLIGSTLLNIEVCFLYYSYWIRFAKKKSKSISILIAI